MQYIAATHACMHALRARKIVACPIICLSVQRRFLLQSRTTVVPDVRQLSLSLSLTNKARSAGSRRVFPIVREDSSPPACLPVVVVIYLSRGAIFTPRSEIHRSFQRERGRVSPTGRKKTSDETASGSYIVLTFSPSPIKPPRVGCCCKLEPQPGGRKDAESEDERARIKNDAPSRRLAKWDEEFLKACSSALGREIEPADKIVRPECA